MFSDHSYLARRNSWEQFLSAREGLDRDLIMLRRAIAFIYFFRKSFRLGFSEKRLTPSRETKESSDVKNVHILE